MGIIRGKSRHHAISISLKDYSVSQGPTMKPRVCSNILKIKTTSPEVPGGYLRKSCFSTDLILFVVDIKTLDKSYHSLRNPVH